MHDTILVVNKPNPDPNPKTNSNPNPNPNPYISTTCHRYPFTTLTVKPDRSVL